MDTDQPLLLLAHTTSELGTTQQLLEAGVLSIRSGRERVHMGMWGGESLQRLIPAEPHQLLVLAGRVTISGPARFSFVQNTQWALAFGGSFLHTSLFVSEDHTEDVQVETTPLALVMQMKIAVQAVH